jgi:hypothetical protein
MSGRTPEDRDRFRENIERGRAARKKMQEILDRVEARRLERQKHSKQ